MWFFVTFHIKKKPQALSPAAYHHLHYVSVTAGGPLPQEVQEEAKAHAVTNPSRILKGYFLSNDLS
jgi:hypothetical protein